MKKNLKAIVLPIAMSVLLLTSVSFGDEIDPDPQKRVQPPKTVVVENNHTFLFVG